MPLIVRYSKSQQRYLRRNFDADGHNWAKALSLVS